LAGYSWRAKYRASAKNHAVSDGLATQAAIILVMFRRYGAEKTMSERLNHYGQPVGPALPGWIARPLPSDARHIVPMAGRYARVEKLDADRHAAELFAAYGDTPDDRDWTYLPVERPATQAAFTAHTREIQTTRDPLHYAIIDLATGTAVGSSAYLRIDPANGAIEVGHVRYSRRLMRTRAGTDAMYLLMRRAFDELGYRRYEWKCDALNAASRRAAERYGFTFEGIFRQAIVVKGRSRDTAWFSVLDNEWPRIRDAFEAWLAPDNFDAAGMQTRTLEELRRTI
jgi:RimJ/RimL family protein N-acetyltransferase